MKIDQLNADARTGKGSSAARKLRAEGKVPGVLYGHGEEAVPLTFSAEQLQHVLETGHQLVEIKLADTSERALVKEVQYDTWQRDVMHVDFTRVGLDELVTVEVSILSHGTPKAIASGSVLEQPLHAIEVECKADEIPENIRVEVGDLEENGKIKVSDLPLPPGVRAKTDPEAIVFIVKATREEIAAPTPVVEGAVEPELIKRAPKEEEETAEKKA